LIRERIALLLLLIAILVGVVFAQETGEKPAKNSSSPSDRVVMKVGDKQVTQAEFEYMIGELEPKGDPDKGTDADKDRRKLGDDYISVLLLSRQALANHLDQTPDIKRQLDVQRMQILSDAQFAEFMRQSTPTAQEISQYYTAHQADFDRVRVQRLFIWKVGTGSKNTKGLAPAVARERADAIIRPSAGTDSEKLAEAFVDSDDGLLDTSPVIFVRGELPPKLETLAFSLKEGQWSEAEETPDRIFLLHLVKRDRRPLTEISSLISQRLQNQKLQAKLSDLKKQSGIWMDEDYFGPAVATVPDAQESSPEQPLSNSGKSAVKRGENQ
jgi:parvulin-like peptidyl-prolyl isomerase